METSCSDVIVVGSGASAVHSVYTVVKAGLKVTMLDVGSHDTTYERLIPDSPFSDIRRTDPVQYRYFLGDNFEGISFDDVGTGPQVTPPRQFVLRHAQTLTPFNSSTFAPAESLAMGGLSGAWGAVCYPFSDYELRKCNLLPEDMRPHYEAVQKRIGVSGSCDDLGMFFGHMKELQPPLEIDTNAEMILTRYRQKSKVLNRAGIYMGQPLMAVLTEDFNGRAAHQYHDMDFWSNKGGSVYRADLTVRELQKSKNFAYMRPYLVKTFAEEKPGLVQVQAKSLTSNKHETFRARKLILAAGALGTTRIVLGSLNHYNMPVSITCNSHTYIPCVHYRGFGKQRKDRCHSLAQLAMVYDPTADGKHIVMSQMYSYRSLLLFKLLNESMLSLKESLRIMRSLSPFLTIFTIQHEDEQSPDKYCILRKGRNGENDYLEIVYRLSREAVQQQQANEKIITGHISKLGCLPIKTVHPGHGSSIHYAGQFPMTKENKPLSTEPSGLLRGTKAVYIADGAGLAYLPAKGLTFTLMANADRIGKNVMREMNGHHV